MSVQRYSRQREAIKEYLMHTDSHPTADSVYAAVKAVYPNISLGTVYRNLNSLCENGEIRKLGCENGPDRFDGRLDEHAHFICTRCGAVLDVFGPAASVTKEAAAALPGTLARYEYMYYGVCTACAAEALTAQKQAVRGEKTAESGQ